MTHRENDLLNYIMQGYKFRHKGGGGGEERDNVCACACVCERERVYACVRTCMTVCVWCVYMLTCMYVHMHVCIRTQDASTSLSHLESKQPAQACCAGRGRR